MMGNPQASETMGVVSAPETIVQQNNWLWKIAVLQLIIIIALTAAFIAQQPLIRYYPVALEVKDKVFYRAEPILDTVDGMEMAIEAFSRRFVLEREEVNLVDDLERWTWVQLYSDQNVWKPFHARMQALWEELHTRSISWDVALTASWRSQNVFNKWTVEFERDIYEAGRLTESEVWLAHLEIGQRSEKADKPALMDNPFQFKVVSYSVEKKAVVIGEQKQ